MQLRNDDYDVQRIMRRLSYSNASIVLRLGAIGRFQISQNKNCHGRLRVSAMHALRYFLLAMTGACALWVAPARSDEHDHAKHLMFDVRTVQDGNWSDKQIWQDGRMPQGNDRVLVSRDTTVVYDVVNNDVLRLVQVTGTRRFARDRETELNSALVKVQDSDMCSEEGFACDLPGINVTDVNPACVSQYASDAGRRRAVQSRQSSPAYARSKAS